MKSKKLNLPPIQIHSFVTSSLTEDEQNKVKGGFTYTCIATCVATKEANCTQLTCFVC